MTFVFFILVPFVQRLSTGAISFGQTLRNFLKTPVIIAIFLGIVANRLGVLAPLHGWPVSDAVLRTVELLGGLTTPLIGLVIGYEVRLQRGNLLKPAQAIALRLLLWVPAGLLLNALADLRREHPLAGDIGDARRVYSRDGIVSGLKPSVLTCSRH